MSDSRWYFTEEQLANSPSRKCGINAELEISYRQRAANLIQEMGQRLQVSQLCINTAIVFMHRFYAFHSFTMFHRNSIAAAAFFLAAKVEEQPRKLEHVIKILNICLEKTDITREAYAEQAQELVLNENILLQTLGFDVAIDHPHTHVVKACQLFNIVTVSRELRQTCYFMASNSLHLTTMCLKYRPTVVAAFCIYIACKWSRWEIPDSSEGKAWYSYVDETVTLDTLKKLTEEYLQILERSPSKFKSKMKAITSNGQAAGVNQSPSIDGPSTSHHKSNHSSDKHHHHHHHNKNASMSNSATNSMGSVNANGNTSLSNSSTSKAPQMASSSSQQQYKPPSSVPQPQQMAASSMNHNLHRQRPSTSSQQGYSSSNSSSNSQHQRLLHQDNSFYNSSSQSAASIVAQRISSEHPKHRTSVSNSIVPPPLPPPQQQQQPPQPYMKMGMSEQQKQQHNIMTNNPSKQGPQYSSSQIQGMDLHQKSMKQSSDYHSSSRGNVLNQQIPNNPQKKQPPWQQQIHNSDKQQQQQQYSHLQKNLQMTHLASNIHDQSASNLLLNNSSKPNLSAYNDMSTKHHQQQQQQHTSTASQNDFWFNDKINELSNKAATPPRQIKSLFSPSPEHDTGTNEKAKYMMMSSSLKRQHPESNIVDSPKEQDIKTAKRDKNSMPMNAQMQQQNQKYINPPLPTATVNQIDTKKFSSKIDSITTIPPLPPADLMDPQVMKKRSYSSIKDSSMDVLLPETKIRKLDQVKSESNIPSSLHMSQSLSQPSLIYSEPIASKKPIETNPDIVKSLLAECFSSSNKFDAYDTDSPLDVINPEPPEELLAPTVMSNIATVTSQQQHIASNSSINNSNSNVSINNVQQQVVPKHGPLEDLLDNKDEKLGDSSAGESSSRKDKKKSKKKKEKHKHKKKHKSSDREDKSDSSSIKIILNKTDTKSSPESYGGGLKIKIPINKEAAAAVVAATSGIKTEVNPAPIKLKISKEKFGNFSNLNSGNNNSNNNIKDNTNNASSSSSSSNHHHHKSNKKDREKSKSKSSSKHYNSSDYKESSSY